jgi:hypothetical protein
MGEGLVIGQAPIEGQALAIAAPSRACGHQKGAVLVPLPLRRPWPW